MIFRGRAPELAVWRRFRSGADGFSFSLTGDIPSAIYEAHIAANAERAVDLFYTLTKHLPPAVDIALDDKRTGHQWIGEDVALPDVRDVIARIKVPLAAYAGVDISIYSADDQLTLTAQLELYIYAHSDRWLYLLLGNGLEEYRNVAIEKWRGQPWNHDPAPVLSEAVDAAALRIALRPVVRPA
jgi:hypothetical protein